MKYRFLGNTGVEVSEIGFGGASISGESGGYGFGDISENDSIELLSLAYDQGITLFDTAPVYGFASSEQRIGKAFRNNREKIFIIDKCGVSWGTNRRIFMSNDPKLAVDMLENSLRTMQTDYIDLYMIHWPDSKIDIRRCFEVLVKEKEKGKIKHLGLCNTNPEDINKVMELDRIEAVQCEYSFFERDNFVNLSNLLQSKKISFFSWGSLDKGILTGRVTKDRKYDKSDCRSWAPWWKALDNSAKFESVKKLDELGKRLNLSLLDLAVKFVLKEKTVTSALVGVRSKEQLKSLLSIHENSLTNEIIDLLDQIYSDFESSRV